MSAGLNGTMSPLAALLSELVTAEGFLPTPLPDVRLMHSRRTHPPSPVVYEPSIVKSPVFQISNFEIRFHPKIQESTK
jgi:hypothetical protein